MRPTLLLFFFALVCGNAMSAPAAGSVVRTLTAEEFKASGLHKLSSAEIAALDAALQRHLGLAEAKPVPAAQPDAQFGSEMLPPPASPGSMRTRIAGRFEGCSGKTIFPLQNGQRWQQRMPDTFVPPRPLENPEVVLERGPFGYRMVIVELRYSIPVKRLK